jgi:hypothetical protein
LHALSTDIFPVRRPYISYDVAMSTQSGVESTQININQPDDVDNSPAAKKAGRPPRDPEEWTQAFLEHYEQWGNMHSAAKHAGVDAKTARKHRRTDRDFERAVKEARRAFRASLEEELVRQGRGISKGQAVPILARLKASSKKLASRYSEKAVDARIMNIYNDNRTVLTDGAALELVARLAPQLTQASMAQLAPISERSEAQIVDVEAAPGPQDGL